MREEVLTAARSHSPVLGNGSAEKPFRYNETKRRGARDHSPPAATTKGLMTVAPVMNCQLGLSGDHPPPKEWQNEYASDPEAPGPPNELPIV
jgi:hypothetical protein